MDQQLIYTGTHISRGTMNMITYNSYVKCQFMNYKSSQMNKFKVYISDYFWGEHFRNLWEMC